MSVFGDYSHYYDLLYADKDYNAEARYVDRLIRRHAPGAVSMLELGCGTGRYTREFVHLGYEVHGVDLSEEMLAEARRAPCAGTTFSVGDMRTLRLGRKFDVVAALFHVFSYQTSNGDVVNALSTVKEHLAPDGVAVLDFWYGPAVLTQKPEVRFKEVSDDRIEVSRIAIPIIHDERNVVDVNYRAFIKDRASGTIRELRECHKMRYFFIQDFEWMLNFDPERERKGLRILEIKGWMSEDGPDVNTWAALAVMR